MNRVHLSCIDENFVTDQLHGFRVSLTRCDGLMPGYPIWLYVLFTNHDKSIGQCTMGMGHFEAGEGG